MKNRLMISTLLGFLALPMQLLADPLEGAWQLTSGFYINDKKEKIDYQASRLQAIKVVNNGYFSFVTESKNKENKEAFWAAGAGRYQIKENQYTEQPNLASFTQDPAARFTFTFEVKDNHWHKLRYQDGELVEHEIWKKL